MTRLPPILLLLSLLLVVLSPTFVRALDELKGKKGEDQQQQQTCSSSSTSSNDDPTCLHHPNNGHVNHIDDEDDDDDIAFQKAHHFRDFLSHMFKVLEDHRVLNNLQPDPREQEQVILTSWLKYMNMDPSVISQIPLSSNWLYDLFQSTKSLAPREFFKIWDERARPTPHEIDILLSIDDAPYEKALEADGQTINENRLMNHLIMPFRHRGFIMVLLDTFTRVLMRPFKTITYGILSPSNLKLIAQYSPLIEVGAGSGYWSAVLQQQYDADIIPYDVDPPIEGEADNTYFDRQYTPIQKSDCQSIFAASSDNNNNNKDTEVLQNRTLLMIWPNNPDNVDNAKEFHSSILPKVWDYDCLNAFRAAGGKTVILIAERERNIHVLPDHPQNPTQPDSGLCSSRKLQLTLEREYNLIHQMSIPTWYYNDDLTIWKLKEDLKGKTTGEDEL